MPIDVRVTFVVRLNTSEAVGHALDAGGGDVSLGVAGFLCHPLPPGMEWVDRRAELAGIIPADPPSPPKGTGE